MKMIIVDDEVCALQLFLGDIVGKADIEYKFFKDTPDEIVAWVARNRADAAFLDINMPGIDGVRLAEKLIDVQPDIRIAFVTGLDMGERDLPARVRESTVGFLYKPYDEDKLAWLLSVVANESLRMTVKTFGSFDCSVNEKPVRFSSQKSKELFALLIAYNGKVLTMSDAISQLWPDLDTARSKILYRDAVWRLRKTLRDINFNCVEFSRAKLYLNKSNISCDYWDFLAGTGKGYKGEFLKAYDWSIDYLAALDSLTD